MRASELMAQKSLLSTSDVCKILGILVSAGLLERLGAVPAHTTKNGVFWDRKDVPGICLKIADHMHRKEAFLTTLLDEQE